jgi:hypothetical protein
MVADNLTQVAARPIPQEPMVRFGRLRIRLLPLADVRTQYLISNLGMSNSFIPIDFDNLKFPAKLRIDYIRVYQDEDNINWGCDPEDFPTKEYIDTYYSAYTNPNLTTWKDLGESYPKNSFLGQC